MKKLLISATLCMLVSFSFAQKKAVKDTKSALNSKNYQEAATLIKPALSDPETANDPETWKLAGDIGYKQFEEESAKQIMRQTHDDDKMYTGLFDSYQPYVKADELGEIPDEKGKIKNKVRKEIMSNFLYAFPYFRNGGAISFEKQDFKKATDFFEIYWNLSTLPMFSDSKSQAFFAKNDTSIQEVKYYAAISALNANENERALILLKRIINEPFIENSTYKESDIYELIADEYKKANDTIAFMQILQDGAKKYPQSTYFIPNLINEYIKLEQMDKALIYLDEAMKNDPANICDYGSVKASIYLNRSDFEKAEQYYQEVLDIDENCERALDGIGRTYVSQALNLKEEAFKISNRKEQTEMNEKANKYFNKAYPALERYKLLMKAKEGDNTEQIKQALVLLRNVYYNLNMSEFDQIEQELNELNNR